MGKIKVGIIGAGQIAEAAHLPNYLKHKDMAEVVAICDVNIDRAKQLGSKFNISEAFDNYNTMLDKCNLDAVSICVTNKFHAAAAQAALNAGCHVLCEKPPAMNYEEALKMYNAAEINGKILAFNFHYRHSQEVAVLKQQIIAGAFGNIYAARVQALRRRGIPGWGSFTNKELQGGGPLIDIGVHMLDTALYLMGFPEPAYVAAGVHQKIGNRPGIGLMGSWDYKNFSIEDSAFGFIKFKNGATLNLETSFALNMKEASLMNVHVFGEKAGASVFPLEVFSEDGIGLTNTDYPHLKSVDKWHESIYDFLQSCANNSKPLCGAFEGLTMQKLIDALYKSSETGIPVIF